MTGNKRVGGPEQSAKADTLAWAAVAGVIFFFFFFSFLGYHRVTVMYPDSHNS